MKKKGFVLLCVLYSEVLFVHSCTPFFKHVVLVKCVRLLFRGCVFAYVQYVTAL